MKKPLARMNQHTNQSTANQRPYFIWNADLTEADVRRIPAESSDYLRVQLMSTVPRYSRLAG